MKVIVCATPAASILGAGRVAHADFRDAYRAPLLRPDLGVTDIFHSIFSHRPAWMNAALIARNAAASVIGLDVPTNAEVLQPEFKAHYAVGDTIGPWPIFHIDDRELVAGRDNTHMDFRLSILKDDAHGAVVSTVCWVKNRFGRHYLSTIIPFHKLGVQMLIANAVEARRL